MCDMKKDSQGVEGKIIFCAENSTRGSTTKARTCTTGHTSSNSGVCCVETDL